MSNANKKPVDNRNTSTDWLLTDEDVLHNGKEDVRLGTGLYTAPEKYKYEPDAWSLVGDLISAGLLPLPDMTNAVSKDRLQYEVSVISAWLKANKEG